VKTALARSLGWIAAAAWLISWFLPVIDGYPGWAAFRAAIEAPFRHTLPTPAEDALPQVFSALTNVAFPVMFLMLLAQRVVNAGRFLRVAIICLVLDLYWLVQASRANELKSLLAGYYVWLTAFVLLVAIATITVVSNRRTSKIPKGGTPP
jgi:hypothetical protein